jgi:carbonic anhydrase
MTSYYHFSSNPTLKTAFLCFLLLFVWSCKKDKTVDESCQKWEYEGANGPDHWVSLCDDYADCKGIFQSPVNITNVLFDPSLKALALNYSDTKTKIVFNGHTIEFEVEGSSKITLNGESFSLKQFHFHSHSEHAIEGEHAPLEAHFVHQNDVTGNRVVIGTLFVEGAENEFLSQFSAHLPTSSASPYSSNEEFNPLDLLPENRSYFTYPGSLTTPPCDQNVIWYVLANPVEASAAQISQFESIMPENARPLRPIQERAIRLFEE